MDRLYARQRNVRVSVVKSEELIEIVSVIDGDEDIEFACTPEEWQVIIAPWVAAAVAAGVLFVRFGLDDWLQVAAAIGTRVGKRVDVPMSDNGDCET